MSTGRLHNSDCPKSYHLYGGQFFGKLPGAGKFVKKSGNTKAFKNGDKMRLELDTGKGTLVAYKNGTRLPGHITGLAGRELHVIVDLAYKGDKVRVAASD